jgi:hypothetical protein
MQERLKEPLKLQTNANIYDQGNPRALFACPGAGDGV